ncbi:MAG: hypothetical protein JWO25_2956 [Alphaproteobacteria bacterium]|nr:hypothetical protein [Alphaproteobacteria bacterium]
MRSALPDDFVRYLDSQSLGLLTAITWIEPHRLRFTAHYAKDGDAFEQRVFKYRAAPEQSRRSRALRPV